VVRFSADVRDSSLRHGVHAGSGAHKTCYSICIGLFLGVKQLESEADHSPHPVPRLRMSGDISPLPRTPAWRLQGQYFKQRQLVIVKVLWNINNTSQIQGYTVPSSGKIVSFCFICSEVSFIACDEELN
jgi:hypothetical protein